MRQDPVSEPVSAQEISAGQTDLVKAKPRTKLINIIVILLAGIACGTILMLLTTQSPLTQEASAPLPTAPRAQQTLPPPVPTAAEEIKEEPVFKIELQGVMSTPAGHVALINGKVYEQGATIEGRKIQTIDLNRITVLYEGVTEEITLKK